MNAIQENRTDLYNLSDNQLWIFGLGTLYTTKSEANKSKDQTVREYIKTFDFFGKTWFIRLSAHALKTAIRSGYIPTN